MWLDVVEGGGNNSSNVSRDPVCDFYTRHPYPPPVENLDRARDEWQDATRHRADYHLIWPGRPYRPDLEILVAGCGTWQAAKYALCRPEAHVVGIDVSTTSIACTDTLKRKYRLENLELHQLPIERVADLRQRFDLIVCTGVLHHLADPDAGLRALRSVLRGDGAMSLMVYAPYGRIGLSLLQSYCRTLDVGPSEQEIRDLMTTLSALHPSHPLATLLSASRDAQHADALADALLNPRERSYTVPELIDFIERNGMALTRWYWQAPYLPQCAAVAATPHAARLAALPERDQYAAMELWRGNMMSHSVVLRRSDAAHDDTTVHFDDETWLRFVPIQLPSTRLVRERVPAGAAAVLLNRSHQHHDLVLAFSHSDMQLFEGIDGRRRIAEIIDGSSTVAPEHARRFFQRLWWYDQVTFDTSSATVERRRPDRRA